LKIDTQIQEDHQAKLTVEVEADTLEGAKHRAARKIASRVKIPGFRPGKAPYPIILKQVGEGAILEDALDLVVDEIYPQVLKDAEIQVYGPGKLEQVSSMDPLTLEFLVPLKPEVVLGDYKSISKPFDLPKVEEKGVQEVLEGLRDRQAIIEPVERQAEIGDIVTVRLNSTRKEVAEGQQLSLIRDQSVPIVVIEGENPNEWPYPGFSANLVGLRANDEKTWTYQYPEDASYENLRGVEAIFMIVVENVKSRTLPELDDDFASSVGEFENLDMLKAEILSSLQHQAEHEYEDSYNETVLEEAVSQSTFKYPAQMLENEIDDVVQNLNNRLEQQKMDMDLYLKSRNMDMTALREEARPVAETRLKKSLVLMEIAKAENITLDQSEVQNETMNTMNTLARSLPKAEVRKLSDHGVVQNLMNNVMADMLTHKAIERLQMIASGKLAIQEAEQSSIEAEASDSEPEPELASNPPANEVEPGEQAE
jgi:trigger factor